ncbi:hypothetical protein [Ornithinimicrobium murale]|uniref:hypothetical protein n=1 Tax=Ornithinimicrobium murale TaxID=1050153 RepID=UPI000E0D6A75|nr:hypothetical protein [Ornithinimicrobium murale]
MSNLAVTHTFEDGALVRGTQRSDGAGEVLKPLGWRWGRGLRAWYLPSSREHAPDRGRLTQAIEQLGQVGHAVEASVVVAPSAGYAAAEGRYIERLQDAREALIARADRHESAANSDNQSTELRWSESQAAAETRARAGRITEQLNSRRSPSAIRGRIAHLQRDVAAGQRTLDALERADERGTDKWCQVHDQLELDRGQLAYWQQTSQETTHGPGTVMPGDQVRIRGYWRTVIRVNAKSVTVQVNGWGSGRTAWADVQEHRAGHPEQPAPRPRRPSARPRQLT